MAVRDSLLLPLQIIKDAMDYEIYNHRTPIAILNYRYNKIKDSALAWHLLDTLNNQLIEVSGTHDSPYDSFNVVVSTTTYGVADSGKVDFILDSNLYISNFELLPDSVMIDFDDGNGYINANWNIVKHIIYYNSGSKTLKIKIDTFITKISFMVDMGSKAYDSTNSFDAKHISEFVFPVNCKEYPLFESLNPYFVKNVIIAWNIQTYTYYWYGHPRSYEFREPIFGDIPYYPKAQVIIKYANSTRFNNNTIIKPFILVSGVDFGYSDKDKGCERGKCGQLGFAEVWSGINYFGGHAEAKHIKNADDEKKVEFEHGADFINALNQNGYDFIHIDFEDGADYMQANALVLQSILEYINSNANTKGFSKIGTEPIVLCGASMGGQVCRYALLKMEQEKKPTCVSEFIAFDTPNKGANIPLGVQEMIKYVADRYGNIAKDAIVGYNKLLRPAAQQLLLLHMAANDKKQTESRISFYNEIESMGSYPKESRMVAIANGSINSIKLGFNAGDELATFKFDARTILLYILLGPFNLWNLDDHAESYAASSNQSLLFHASPPNGNDQSYNSPVGALNYDNCPGSRTDLLKSLNFRIITDEIELRSNHDYTSFIPLISALGVYTDNLDYDVNNTLDRKLPNRLLYPYDAFYSPDKTENELHVQLTLDGWGNYINTKNGNINWVLNEIITHDRMIESELPYNNLNKYNFATSKHTTLYDLQVKANGVLQINGDDYEDYLGATVSNKCTEYRTNDGTTYQTDYNFIKPQEGSTLDVKTSTCGAYISVEADGAFVIGEPTVGNKGNVYFRNGSTLELLNGSSLTINDGSKLVIQDGAVLSAFSGANINLMGSIQNTDIEIENGGELHLNGQLTVTNNSRILVKSGGKLIVKQFALIYLLGSNSLIEVEDGGVIHIDDNTTLSFNGAGKIKFTDFYPYYNNVTCSTNANAKIRLVGSTLVSPQVDHVVLEVEGDESLTLPDGLAEFKVENATINLKENCRINAACSIYFDYVRVTSQGIGMGMHRGIHTFGQSGVEIKNSTFKFGKFGIHAYNTYYQNPLKLNNCTFNYCTTPIYAYDKGVNLESILFEDCESGLRTENMARGSSIKFVNGSFLTSPMPAVYYRGLIGGNLTATSNNFSNNQGSIAFLYYGPTLTMRCNELAYNAMGLVAYPITLNMSEKYSKKAGRNNITNSQNEGQNMILPRCGSILLEDGYNNFSNSNVSQQITFKNVAGASNSYIEMYYDLTGNTLHATGVVLDLIAHHNFWDPNATYNSPDEKMYIKSTYPQFSQPIHVVDASPLTSIPWTSSDDCPSYSTYSSPTIALPPDDDGKIIDGNIYSNLDITEAVSNTLVVQHEDNNLLYAIDLWHDIIMHSDYNNTSIGVRKLVELCYGKMIEAIGEAAQDGVLSITRDTYINSYFEKVIEVQDYLLYQNQIGNIVLFSESIYANESQEFEEVDQDFIDYAKYRRKLELNLHKAFTFRMAEQRTTCLDMLNAIESWVNTSDLPILNYYQCSIDKEIRVINDSINKFEIDSIEVCTYPFSTTTNADMYNNSPMTPIFKKEKPTITDNQSQLAIAPNPSDGLINIQMMLLTSSDVAVDIYDLTGKKIRAVVLQTKFQEGIYNIKADITDLSAGIYIVESRVGHKIYKNKVVKN